MPRLRFNTGQALMPKVDVRASSPNSRSDTVSALMDTGAAVSFIVEDVATVAGIQPVSNQVFDFNGANGGFTAREARCTLELLGTTGTPRLTLPDFRIFIAKIGVFPAGALVLLGQEGFMSRLTYWQHHRSPTAIDRRFGVQLR